VVRESAQHRVFVGVVEDAAGPLAEEGAGFVGEFFVTDLRQAGGSGLSMAETCL
jgi:hypothetical protein